MLNNKIINKELKYSMEFKKEESIDVKSKNRFDIFMRKSEYVIISLILIAFFCEPIIGELLSWKLTKPN